MRGRLLTIAGVVLAVLGAYGLGLYSYQRDLWPLDLIRNALHLANITPLRVGTYGQFGRLIGYPGKTEVPCPVPAADTAIILAIGQSNAANHGSERALHQPTG
jgi:hypothetical protein